MTTSRRRGPTHPQRKEIARYLLSRGLDAIDQVPDPARMAELAAPMDAPLASAVAPVPPSRWASSPCLLPSRLLRTRTIRSREPTSW